MDRVHDIIRSAIFWRGRYALVFRLHAHLDEGGWEREREKREKERRRERM